MPDDGVVVLLLRHGQIASHRGDLALTDEGVRTARRAAEALAAAGRRSEAEEELTAALAFYRSVGAEASVRKGEALLAPT